MKLHGLIGVACLLVMSCSQLKVYSGNPSWGCVCVCVCACVCVCVCVCGARFTAITHSILETAMYKTNASSMFMCCLGNHFYYVHIETGSSTGAKGCAHNITTYK